MKRIFCILLVIFLLSLYLITFVFSFFTTKDTSGLFFACLFSTMVIPTILYCYQFVLKSMQKRNEAQNELKDELKHKNPEEKTKKTNN